MTPDAAKQILSAYRSDDQDREDPVFREALEHLERDAELKAWFQERIGIDRVIREKISGIEPPAYLQAQILARIRKERVRRFALPAPWLALAACLVLGGLALVYSTGVFTPNRFQEFRQDALAMVSVQPAPQLDLLTPNLNETQNFLREHQAPSAEKTIPAVLKSMSTAGCRAFVWRQHPASLTCFLLPDGQLLHLIVIDQAAIGDGNIPASYHTDTGWHVMFQQKNGMLLMWATRAPMDKLKQMLVAI